MLVRIANREYYNQTASSEAVLSGSVLFVYTCVLNFRTSTINLNFFGFITSYQKHCVYVGVCYQVIINLVVVV